MNPCKLFLSAAIAIGTASTTYAAPFVLPDLPYGYDALEPIIGEKTLRTHHLKHHAKYVNTANAIIEKDASLQDLSPEQIIGTHQDNPSLFNNVAQSWNHNFYWHCMKPDGGGIPHEGMLADAINKDFGSYDKFVAEMETAALTTFGSGWAWLGYDGKKQKLVVTKTTGAGNPLTDGIVPILTIDVWEHAYYLDYQEKRPSYVHAFFAKLVNWEFAEMNFNTAPTMRLGADEAPEL